MSERKKSVAELHPCETGGGFGATRGDGAGRRAELSEAVRGREIEAVVQESGTFRANCARLKHRPQFPRVDWRGEGNPFTRGLLMDLVGSNR